MKEAEIFENYMNRLSEGTWALPDTPEAYEKLQQLMTGELIVGADAMNATEQLYDLVGDDELFDILNDLADNDPRANIWDDSDVQRRLAELGVQTPQSTQAAPAAVPQDTAPPVSEETDKDWLNQRHGQPDKNTSWMNKQHQDFYDKNPSFKQAGKSVSTVGDSGRFASTVVPSVTDTKVDRIPMNTFGAKQGSNIPKSIQKGGSGRAGGGGGFGGVRPGQSSVLDNPIQNENAELARMLEHAGVPLQEGVLTDSTGSTMDHIQDRFRRDIKDFTETGDMSDDLYDALYDYYFDDMPYGTKKARTGDPHEWIADRFASDLGINENLISPMIMPVSEGSCNMTMEGSYCPEHGLAECGGGMYEDEYIPRVEISGFGPDKDEYIPRVEIRGFGPDFEDLPAGKKLINPMQPRRHNELSPLTPGDSTPRSKVANVDLTMDEDGGAVGMPYSMGEGVDDPINYNAAMTGSYYEGKETDIQEGDALLARIKSLALLR
jgi:hypothetical protein